jgi:nucleoside-diphosphate-sugar epimerase
MKVLVTGGAGYVGSRLVHRLLELGHEVTIFDSFIYGVTSTLYLQKAGAILIRGDVRDDVAVMSACQGQEAVFHLASLVGFPVCAKHPVKAYKVIVEGTENVIRGCRVAGDGDIPLLYASTGSVYGKIDDLCTEDTPPNPQSEYGKYKFEAEQKVLSYGGVGLRFATVFGLSTCMRYDLMPNDFCWKAVRDGYIVLYRGSDRRTFLLIEDTVDAYLAAWTNYSGCSGEAYNVGDEKLNLTKQALAESVQSLHTYNLIAEGTGEDPDFRDYEVNYHKFKAATGFRSTVSLAHGLQEVLDFTKVADLSVPWRLPL